MDPTASSKPDESGYVEVSSEILLHYELYSPSYSHAAAGQGMYDGLGRHHEQRPSHQLRKSRVLLIMGAFATKAHFASTARYLAEEGYEVLIYDHRGVGESGKPVMEQQTSAMLAADGVVVINTVWGETAALHVYGASMGGLIAQELALLLLPKGRLLSLGLTVTCRGLKPLGGLLSPFFVPQIVKPVFDAWYWDSRQGLVRRLMRLLLPRSLQSMTHPSGQTYQQVYYKEWLDGFDKYWTFNDHTAGACHACVCLHHYLSDWKVAILRDSGVPILCQVHTQDLVIPPAMQLELGQLLRARTVTFPTGHMGLLPWKERFHNLLLEHFAMGDALWAVSRAERARLMPTVSQRPDSHQLPGKLSLMSSALGRSSSSLCSSGSSGSSIMGPEECQQLSLDAAASIGSSGSLDSMCYSDPAGTDGSRAAAAARATAPDVIGTQN